MDRHQFLEYAKTCTAIPVWRMALADTLTPVSVFLRIRQHAQFPFLFESVEGGEQLARYSFLGKNPYQVFRYDGTEARLEKRDGDIQSLGSSYYDALRPLTQSYIEPKIPDLPRLTGGAVGFSSYDTIRQTEHLPNVPDDELDIPDAVWAFYDEIFAFDHVKHRIVMLKTVFTKDLDEHELNEAYDDAQAALDRMESELSASYEQQTPLEITSENITSNFSRERFHEVVDIAKKHIFEGDIFQVVLSQRFSSGFSGDRFMLYRALRMVNPSPYLFYLDFDAFALVGSSPEVLVSVQDGLTKVLPIAGTRPRGRSAAEDQRFAADLAADAKEVAEHVMLVDLGRNDLSRICKPGTVRVTKDQIIERYSHVMHIVSEVTGQLGSSSTAVDALQHCFPAGTVSGAPKVRAMEIIDALEPVKRGPYAGAVGYFDFSGNMDTCIAIRTMVATRDTVYIQAGAGIVADSVPENEYQETYNKARALFEALKLSIKM
ncbi:anthranilate synthase, component I [Cyclonatronum proteinivorum]|uniref:Anthranilate synthase component 1 n=1 Tax=Cyclonatronum proteinivorum TaxID=1457365 RepID=A0A345UKN7_9BACT|nr:anthranilate synthase component I [Cyclonatronum proteinivorum]AXJ01039.1 anthranilate synthase, component I [Cyclonatronum proteinivorum]